MNRSAPTFLRPATKAVLAASPALWKRLAAPFGGVLLPLLVFGWLSEDVLEGEPFPFDLPIMFAFHRHASHALDTLALTASFLGGVKGLPLLGVLVMVLLWRAKHQRAAMYWVVATLGAALLNLLEKAFFGRDRPALWPSLAPEHTFSFPSGHATASMGFCAALCVLAWNTKWRWPSLVFTLLFVPLVGWSRAYLGVHYPSDILAGWVAALSWVLGARWALRGVWQQKPAPSSHALSL